MLINISNPIYLSFSPCRRSDHNPPHSELHQRQPLGRGATGVQETQIQIRHPPAVLTGRYSSTEQSPGQAHESLRASIHTRVH